MIKVFVLKPLSGFPTDGIDNVNREVWKRIDPKKISFYASSETGLFKRLALMRKLKPDFVWGIGKISDLLFLFFAPSRTRYIINWHTVLFKPQEAPWKVRTPWLIRKFIFNQADKIITVSDFAAQKILAIFPNQNVKGILNGVDADFFNPNRKNKEYLISKYNIDFSKPIILFVGALVKRKRPDLFMALAPEYKRANFVMVGENRDNFDLKGAKWIKMMPREDIAILMASSDLFVFPSLNEPCAAVIQEAMASGLAVLLSDLGGNKEFIMNGQEGYLIDVKKDNFLDYIDLALNNQNLKINARKKAVRDFSWQKVAEKYEDYICSA